MDTSTVCPVCLQENAISDGYCRFCKKRINLDLPVGVLPPGIVLHGRYLTGIFLGQGGFGTIYKALDLATRRVVAIKEYFPAMWCTRQRGNSRLTVTDPEDFEYGLKHFRGEAEIMRSLQNIPEVVRLYDSFDENGTGYYVMEFLEGETIQGYLRSQGGKLSFHASVSLLMPAILALKKVHDAGTTHRDISPDNIFLCRNGTLRIIDFGAAASLRSNLSRSFIPVEKEGYSPPEQHTISSRGDAQGTWSDIYAMAGTLYRCCIGRRPPSSSQRQAGDRLEFERSGLTPQQVHTLEKNLSLNPKDRCQDMLSFAKELTQRLKSTDASRLRLLYPVLSGTDPVPPSPPSPTPSPKPSSKMSKSFKTRPERDPARNRKIAAYLLDMFFFQAVPYALSQLIGGPVLLWLFGGLAVGVLVTWLMTCSDAGGGPGEVVCGLEVSAGGGRPDRRAALLYCLIRIFWPLKIAEAICFLTTKEALNTALSGCSSQAKGVRAAAKQLILKVTAGFYQGSAIPITTGRYVFGRNPERCNIIFPLVYNVVSRVHFELVIDAAGNAFITSKSAHGTWLDGRRLIENVEEKVAVGSKITFGKEEIIITTN